MAVACGGDGGGETTTGGGGGDGGSGGSVVPTPSDDWCEGIEPGVASGEDERLGWSAAHAHARFFGVVPDRARVDGALVAALSEADEADEAGTAAYVEALGATEVAACAVAGEATGGGAALGAAEVTMDGGLAIVRPGTGTVVVPAEAKGIAIDLRELPSGVGLEEVLATTTEAVLAAPVDRGVARVREHRGMADEVFSVLNAVPSIYETVFADVPLGSWPGAAASERPVAVLTDAQLAPEATELAMGLRLAERAVVIGGGLWAAVAESRWFSIGGSGLAVRDRVIGGASSWPDVVAADRPAVDAVAEARRWLEEGAPGPSPVEGGATRPGLAPLLPPAAQADEQNPAVARAAVTVAHGASRLFFPYFSVVGDTIDTGLADAWSALEEAAASGVAGPALVREGLRPFGHHLHDSHVFMVYAGSQSSGAARVPVLLDATADGTVVVRNSAMGSLAVGDRLVAVDGVPVSEAIAAMMPTLAASTPTATLRNALSRLAVVSSATTWTMMDPSDATSDVALDPSALPSTPPEVVALSTRTAGTLDDLGRPDVYYVNLDGPAYDGVPSASEIVGLASAAGSLVLDARGYPDTLETWTLIQHVLGESTTIQFNVPWRTPFGLSLEPSSQAWASMAPTFDGPVVVLIAPHTQSQAEHIVMPLVSTGRATFVGRQTAAANGNITGAMVPGAFGFTFTGMEVLFDDGSTFHGQGILPTIEVHPTVAGLVAGEDPELTAALAVL